MSKQYIDSYGYVHIITEEISRGGQGVVYRTTDPNIAVKVEISSKDDTEIINKSGNRKFLDIWLLPIPNKVNITLPKATLETYSGYTMTLLEDMESFEKGFNKEVEEIQMNSWLKGIYEQNEECGKHFANYVATGGKKRRLFAYLKCAVILSKLHANGLVYCDFSQNNVFISSNKQYCNVWIIDADNLNYQALTLKEGYYTPGYAAPEVIRGKGCTFYSDAYSFAISLFWQLTNRHPFRGACIDNFEGDFVEEIEACANNGELPWILDQEDKSNSAETPIPSELLLSNKIIQLFNQTFCLEGRQKRFTRPSMFEWSEAIAYELDHTICCNNCGMEYVAGMNDLCPWCEHSNKLIYLKSYFYNSYKKGRVLWEYYHEISGQDIESIPLRVSEGFEVDSVDTVLMDIQTRGTKLILSNFNYDVEVSVLTDENSTQILRGTCELEVPFGLICKSKNTQEIVLVEVSIL